jgi:hypothetical protein
MRYLPPFKSLHDVMNLTVIRGRPTPNMTQDDVKQLISRLLWMVDVDEEWYLARNPDVAEAVRGGMFKSGRDHFVRSGYFEGLQPFPILVNSDWYVTRYPDIGAAIEAGKVKSAQDHFERIGYREGRLPFPV